MTTTRQRRNSVWRKWLLLPALALSLMAHGQVAPKAAAVPDEAALQEVIVTGSRIARPEFDNLEPTSTVDPRL